MQVLRADAQGFEDGDWADAGNRAVILVLQQGDDTVAVLLNASGTTVEFTLPEKPGGGTWSLGLSSDHDQAVEGDATTLLVRDASFTAMV